MDQQEILDSLLAAEQIDGVISGAPLRQVVANYCEAMGLAPSPSWVQVWGKGK